MGRDRHVGQGEGRSTKEATGRVQHGSVRVGTAKPGKVECRRDKAGNGQGRRTALPAAPGAPGAAGTRVAGAPDPGASSGSPCYARHFPASPPATSARSLGRSGRPRRRPIARTPCSAPRTLLFPSPPPAPARHGTL